jgi:predicted ArsR family transcriptional regulator
MSSQTRKLIIESLTREGPASLKELVERTGVKYSTLHNDIYAMSASGVIERMPEGGGPTGRQAVWAHTGKDPDPPATHNYTKLPTDLCRKLKEAMWQSEFPEDLRREAYDALTRALP